ncbi:MAG TPA: hypothetical protein VMH35_26690 [Streptosporangiaceae bacterium]|nr:hypothetical protein [Streptosporangiaceae bacterium]
MAHQGPQPPRSSRLSGPRNSPRWNEAGYPDYPDYPDENEELPPWAGLAIDPRWAGGRERNRPGRPPHQDDQDGLDAPASGGPSPVDEPAAPRPRPRGRRQAAARARRARRSMYLWSSVVIVAAVLGGGLYLLLGRGSPAARQPGAMVTTFLPGEFQAAPNACTAVSAATLSQYLPGKRTIASPSSLDGGAASLCSWTLDARPLYRLLNVQVQAYAPNGLASGDGSATNAAIDGYAQALQQKTNPPKKTRLPKALITVLPDLGSKAFSALQKVRAGGVTTDQLTVLARDRNVLVTVVFEGDSGRGGYTAPAVSQLTAGAVAAARDVLSQLKS